MASLRVLAFHPEGRPVAFDTWHDDLQLYLLSNLKDSVSVFDHMSGAAPAPPATADAQALYDAVVARYSSPATAAIGRPLLPYLFPELSAFATVVDLVTHLRTSDARYRATVLAEFLPTNQPPMFITLYFIVTRLLDSLRSVRDHFLTLNPTSLTVDLLEQHLLAAETSAVAVGAARGTLRSPFFEGCSPSPLNPSFASAAAADVSVPEDVGAASTSAKRRTSKGKSGRGSGGSSGGGGGGSGSGSGGSGRGGGGSGGGDGGGTGGGGGGSGGSGGGSGGSGGSGGPGGGQGQQQQRQSETQTPLQLREWLVQRRTGGGSETCSYVIRTGVRADQKCGRFHTEHRCFARLDDAWCAEFGGDIERPRWAQLLQSGVAIFDLDYNAILSAMYALYFSASASGTPPGTAPAEAFYTFTLDSGASRCFFRLHLPSFSMNLVGTAALQDAMVTTTTPGGQRVSICTCTLTGRHLATFTRRPWSCLYTLATEPPQVAASAQVSMSGQVAASFSCSLLSHQTLLWHHHLGHPSLPRLRGMHSRLLVSGIPWPLPPLPPSPASPCLPCVEGRQRAAPHSSSFPLTTSPLQTLHMDVEGEVSDVLIPWIRTICLQLRERFGQDLPVLHLHSERGGEFSSDLLREFCCGEGITQSFTLPDSPLQNGIDECCIGLVMEVARTSMIHATAPRFLWPRVSLSETSPTLRWTGKVGDASVFRVWGSRAFVRDTSADKLSARAIPCVFLGFVPDAPGWHFYHPTSRRVLPSQDVTFDESVPFYHLFPYRSAPPPPPPLFLAPGPPQVAIVSGAAPSAASGGAASRGAASGGAEPGGAGSEGAGSRGAESGGAEPRGAASSGGPAGATPRLSSQELREWLVRRAHCRSGAPGAGGARDTRAGGAGAAGAGVGGTGTGGAGAARAGAVNPGAGVAGDTVWPRPYLFPLLQQPASSLPAPSPYTEQSGGLTERREPASRPVSPIPTARRTPHSRPPPVPGTHTMALRPSSVPLRVPLPAPHESSLPEVPDPASDRACIASPTVTRLLATTVTNPSFESAAASALVAEFESASPPSVGGECALGTDVLQDRQEDFECLPAAVRHFASLLLAPEGDPDAPDIPTSRSYAEAITGTQWSLRLPVYGLRQAPREWHNTLRTTLAGLGFAPSTADPSLFLRTDTSLPPFYVLLYVDDLVFATAETEALTLVKSEL
ncbi:unnamed protein product [Closterium sp. NIES-54]